MNYYRYALIIVLISGTAFQFVWADDGVWLTPTRQAKLTKEQSRKIELLLSHDIIDKPNYHDISPDVKVIKLPSDSPLRLTHTSKKLQLLTDRAVLLAPDGIKTLLFSSDEGEAGRISFCQDSNCRASRIFCKVAKDVSDAAWFPDSRSVAFTESPIYGERPGVWIWDSESQTASRIVQPNQVNGSSDSGFYQISVSPNGNIIWFVHDPAISRSDGHPLESWVYSVSDKTLRKLESKRYYDSLLPAWSVDGKRIKIDKKIFEVLK